MTIQRYELLDLTSDDGPRAMVTEYEEGTYVLHSDHVAEVAALKEENAQLKARVAELERDEPITAILAYRNKGYRGVCGATVGADGQGIYAVVYRGLSFDAASNHARNLIRELDASKYQIGEYLFVDAQEGIAGNPISIITKEPANEG